MHFNTLSRVLALLFYLKFYNNLYFYKLSSIFAICVLKGGKVWCLGVEWLFALNRGWLNDLYHIKDISHGLKSL